MVPARSCFSSLRLAAVVGHKNQRRWGFVPTLTSLVQSRTDPKFLAVKTLRQSLKLSLNTRCSLHLGLLTTRHICPVPPAEHFIISHTMCHSLAKSWEAPPSTSRCHIKLLRSTGESKRGRVGGAERGRPDPHGLGINCFTLTHTQPEERLPDREAGASVPS